MQLVSPKVLEQPALIRVLAPRRPIVDDCPIDPADTPVNRENFVCIFCVGEPRVKILISKRKKVGPMVKVFRLL